MQSEHGKKALEDIWNGGKIKATSKTFNIPESKIRDRLQLADNYDPPMGRNAIFSKEEKEMISFIDVCNINPVKGAVKRKGTKVIHKTNEDRKRQERYREKCQRETSEKKVS